MARWEVVGGQGVGRVVVWEGHGLNSQKLAERLLVGAIVRELALEGGRLRYELVSGGGPKVGWVDVSLDGQELMRPVAGIPDEPAGHLSVAAATGPGRGAGAAAAAALGAVLPLASSRWVAKYQHRPGARCRLLCVFGAGADATAYAQWNELAAAEFPEVELVLLQLPGRGLMRQQPLQRRAEAVAKSVVEELQSLEVEGGGAPMALLGFSMGASLAYKVELELEAIGRQALRLYVSGRGGPGISYKHPEEPKQRTPQEYVCFFANAFCPPSIQARLLKLAGPAGDEELCRKLRDMYRADLELGNPFLDDQAPDPAPIACGVHVLASRGDAVWPIEASAERSVACTPAYDDLVETWRAWTTQGVESTIFDDLAHYDLCGPALLRAVCADLCLLLNGASGADNA